MVQKSCLSDSIFKGSSAFCCATRTFLFVTALPPQKYPQHTLSPNVQEHIPSHLPRHSKHARAALSIACSTLPTSHTHPIRGYLSHNATAAVPATAPPSLHSLAPLLKGSSSGRCARTVAGAPAAGAAGPRAHHIGASPTLVPCCESTVLPMIKTTICSTHITHQVVWWVHTQEGWARHDCQKTGTTHLESKAKNPFIQTDRQRPGSSGQQQQHQHGTICLFGRMTTPST